MKEPSEKQIYCVKWISNVTGKPVPKEYSAHSYWLYISENIDRAREIEKATCLYKQSSDHSRKEIQREYFAQVEADRKRLHCSPTAYADYILSGGRKPSWVSGSDAEYRKHLRDLGYKAYGE